MKRLPITAAFALAGSAFAPAFAPAAAQAAPEAEAVVRAYVAAFNKADAAALSSGIVKFDGASEDDTRAKFAAEIAALRAEDFGKLDLYGVKSCPAVADKAQVEMRYAYVYTFGGTMPFGDQVALFDVANTDAGWRIVKRTEKPWDSALACS